MRKWKGGEGAGCFGVRPNRQLNIFWRPNCRGAGAPCAPSWIRACSVIADTQVLGLFSHPQELPPYTIKPSICRESESYQWFKSLVVTGRGIEPSTYRSESECSTTELPGCCQYCRKSNIFCTACPASVTFVTDLAWRYTNTHKSWGLCDLPSSQMRRALPEAEGRRIKTNKLSLQRLQDSLQRLNKIKIFY
jgi:hypothetical protein